MAGMLTRSNAILRPQLLITSPPKSFYQPERVCFRRNTNTLSLLSSSGVDRRLVLSVPPHHKLNTLNYHYALDSYLQKKTNKPFVVDNNNHQHSSSSSSFCNKLVEIKKTVINTLASSLLFGFLVFMTTPSFKSSAFAATLSSPQSLSSCDDSRVHQNNDNIDLNEEFWIKIIAKLLGVIFFIILAPLTIPIFFATLFGYKYYLEICEDTKEKSVLMLQVGVLDKTRELQGHVRNITRIASTSNLDEVVEALLHHYDSCRFAYLSVTQCISDDNKYGNNFAEMMDSFKGDPEALIMVYDLFLYFAKSFANVIHSALIKAIKKVNYNDKSPKQLFADVLSRELAKHNKDEETLASVDGMKCKEEAFGKAHGLVENDYLVVTILVLASGVYSIPPLQYNTEHVKKVLQKFSRIPKSKIESLQVLLSPQTEIESATKQGLGRNFPLLKPLTLSGLEK